MFRQALKAKLPELLLEAASVMFAVLLALAVDEWREERANAELAERAFTLVVQEVRNNREELAGTRDGNAALLGYLTGWAETPPTASRELVVDYSVALLSTAAWEAARVSQAAHYMGLERISELSSVYDVQNDIPADSGSIDRPHRKRWRAPDR